MTSDPYRSYVVRIRRRGPGLDVPEATVRLDVEDLQDGGRAAVTGEPARTLADRLARLIDDDVTGDGPPVG